ncbi:hypothetical protein DCAR_0624427 [Daucus carota subsp. sativus]|uniref:Uncharacterized protein n=1 Tax=Daucus carota subsp. sativus TaxID=79200 RepID=A0A164VU24_DAUCS|nr:hypothetical protein DCAR_0624427 [Daucus carota subsp. sativus]
MSDYDPDLTDDSSSESNPDSSVRITNKFSDLLEKTERLGAGGFGSVYKCVHTLEGKEYAVKRIELKNNRKQLEWCLREVKALSCLEHKHVSWTDTNWDGFSSTEGSQSQESEESKSQESEGSEDSPVKNLLYLFIQMEYCPSTLKSKLEEQPVNHFEVLTYLHHLVKGLDYIHNSGFLHRDLAMKNIFIGKDKRIKIGDFGLAKELIGQDDDDMYCSHSPHSESIGIGFHRAPELKQHQPYSKKSDFYALGITYLDMLLVHVETDHERSHIIDGIKKGIFPVDWKFDTALPRALLAELPEARPNATQILKMIEDAKKARG